MPRHIHKFERKLWGKRKDWPIYKCVLPGCGTYYPEDLIAGKESICWRCKEPFIITPKAFLKKPHCLDCVNPKLRRGVTKPKEVSLEISDILSKLDELLK